MVTLSAAADIGPVRGRSRDLVAHGRPPPSGPSRRRKRGRQGRTILREPESRGGRGFETRSPTAPGHIPRPPSRWSLHGASRPKLVLPRSTPARPPISSSLGGQRHRRACLRRHPDQRARTATARRRSLACRPGCQRRTSSLEAPEAPSARRLGAPARVDDHNQPAGEAPPPASPRSRARPGRRSPLRRQADLLWDRKGTKPFARRGGTMDRGPASGQSSARARRASAPGG